MCRRARATAHTRVDPTQAGIENILKLAERQVRNLKLANLWDDDEALTDDIDCMCDFDVTGEDEHQVVARAQSIILIHRSGEISVKLGGRQPEHIETEDRFAAVRIGVM